MFKPFSILENTFDKKIFLKKAYFKNKIFYENIFELFSVISS